MLCLIPDLVLLKYFIGAQTQFGSLLSIYPPAEGIGWLVHLPGHCGTTEEGREEEREQQHAQLQREFIRDIYKHRPTELKLIAWFE